MLLAETQGNFFLITENQVIIAMATFIGTNLIVVVGVLWKIVFAYHKETKEKLQNCEAHHEEAGKELSKMQGRLSYLEGKSDGAEQLAEKLLKEIGITLKDDVEEFIESNFSISKTKN